jgi:hypothetical protein
MRLEIFICLLSVWLIAVALAIAQDVLERETDWPSVGILGGAPSNNIFGR